MALFTSILAFAGNATNALATAAAPNARRDFSTSGSGALDGLRAAAEVIRLNKRRIEAAVSCSQCTQIAPRPQNAAEGLHANCRAC